MRNNKFFCKDCNKYFNEVKIYEEKHGLDYPPYQRVAICPNCGGDNFCNFNGFIEKTDVAEKTLPIIMMLNNFSNSLKDVFGKDLNNENLNNSIEMIAEFINEMFDFLDADMEKKIIAVDSDGMVNMILKYLKGEF